jgi:hypothetical protein
MPGLVLYVRISMINQAPPSTLQLILAILLVHAFFSRVLPNKAGRRLVDQDRASAVLNRSVSRPWDRKDAAEKPRVPKHLRSRRNLLYDSCLRLQVKTRDDPYS